MDLKAKIEAFTQGKELTKLDDAARKKLTIPCIEDAPDFQIPVASPVTVVLPGFQSDAFDHAILALLNDSTAGPAGVGPIKPNSDTRVVIDQNDFKAGDRVRVVSYLRLRAEGIYAKGLESDYYTFK